MKKNSGYIGNLTIASAYPHIVYGSVRGLVSEHKKYAAAEKSRKKDQSDCESLPGRAYSDCSVYSWHELDGWVIDNSSSDDGYNN